MEELMVKAIRQFKREHKDCEIRSCSAWEFTGNKGKVTSALFNIEYVEESCGYYKEIQYYVKKESK